jgi:hypothetical protein
MLDWHAGEPKPDTLAHPAPARRCPCPPRTCAASSSSLSRQHARGDRRHSSRTHEQVCVGGARAGQVEGGAASEGARWPFGTSLQCDYTAWTCQNRSSPEFDPMCTRLTFRLPCASRQHTTACLHRHRSCRTSIKPSRMVNFTPARASARHHESTPHTYATCSHTHDSCPQCDPLLAPGISLNAPTRTFAPLPALHGCGKAAHILRPRVSTRPPSAHALVFAQPSQHCGPRPPF